MCKFLRNHKYTILIVILGIILIFCIYTILINLQNENITQQDIVNSYSSFFIGIISIIGILFNLSDNEKLRSETKEMKLYEINQQNTKYENIKLLISHEVSKNLSILKDYDSKINMEDKSILVKPNCSNSAWKSLYTTLPDVFEEIELELLIKFYEKIDLLLDNTSWLQFRNAKSIGAFENIRMEIDFTEVDFEEAASNKKFIKNHIESTLLLEKDLSFLKCNKE